MVYGARAGPFWLRLIGLGGIGVALTVSQLLPGAQPLGPLSSGDNAAICGFVSAAFLVGGILLFAHPEWGAGAEGDRAMTEAVEQDMKTKLEDDAIFETEWKE